MSSVNLNIIDKTSNIYYKNNPKCFDDLITLILNNPIHYSIKLKNDKKLEYLKKWIGDQLKILVNSNFQYSYATKIYWILSGLTNFPICLSCKKSDNYKNKNILSLTRGYPKCCCRKCAFNNPERGKKISNTYRKAAEIDKDYWKKRNEKSKQTFLKKYGVENPSQSDIVKNKKIKTFQKHYGIDYGFQSKIIINKIENTLQEKYGVKHILQSEEYRNKFKQTCINRFGVEHPMYDNNIRRKTRRGYKYNNIFFDSSWELCLYIYLTDNNINFVFQPNTCNFIYYANGIMHKYFPDFLINNEYIELKGDHMIDPITKQWIPPPYVKKILSESEYKLECIRIAEKYKCAIRNNVKILTYKDCQKYLNYINEKYGKKYLKQFKISKSY